MSPGKVNSQALLFAALLTMQGCMVGPDYVKPNSVLPDKWKQGENASDGGSAKEWWKSLNDPVLNHLIDKALASNHNRQIVKARIREVRARRLSAASALYPEINGGVGASHGQPGAITFNHEFNVFQPELDATFEIDLFGGNRRNVEAQDALLAAAESSYEDFTLSLIAEVADEYTTWRELQQRANLTMQTVEAQKALYELNQVRFKAGLANDLDVSQAETLLRTTETQIPLITRQLADTNLRLTLLLGENPGEEDAELNSAAPVPSFEQLPGLFAPAAIIARRPDVHSAERMLAAATALEGVAISEFYPKLSLSGLYGYQDSNLLPPVTLYSVAGSLATPILNFGRIEGHIDASKARQVEAFHAYQQTVLAALADVETHLADYAQEQQRRRRIQLVVDSSTHTLELARARYDNGLAPFLDVLDAQQRLYSSQIELAVATGNSTRYAVALSKSLGAY